jgi:hypothetical protein
MQLTLAYVNNDMQSSYFKYKIKDTYEGLNKIMSKFIQSIIVDKSIGVTWIVKEEKNSHYQHQQQ